MKDFFVKSKEQLNSSLLKMSLLEPRLSDLRSGFSSYGFSGSLNIPSPSMLPIWRPPPAPPVSWCTIPNCSCSLGALSRSYFMSELYEYSYSYGWPWYLKSAQDPLYKSLTLPPPPPPSLDRSSLDHSPSHLEPIDRRSSPGKELPSKLHKQERHAERFELAKPLNFDKDHALQHQRRQELLCSTNQSSRRSLTPEPYRNGETTHSSESYSLPHHPSHHNLLTQSLSSRQNGRTPPPLPPHHPPPPRYSSIDFSAHHDGPLNLSITNTNNGNGNDHSPSQTRPSVITCANTSSVTNGCYENGGSGSSSPSSREVSSEVVDPAIEEHFRRSLGKSYSEIIGKQPSVTPSVTPSPPPLSRSLPSMHVTTTQSGQSSPVRNSPPPSKQNSFFPANLSITGSVDDHFARALGDKWSALQNKKDPKLEIQSPGSVDDHFEKALGDTWLRIKAERESPRGPPPPFGVAHQITHQLNHLPHPHSLTHQISPRSSSPSSQSHNASLLST